MALEIYTTYNDIPFVLLASSETKFFESFKENVKIAKWEEEIVTGLWKNCNRVYQYNTIENTFTLVGYYIFKLESAPTLVGKSQLKKYEGAFIVYDGSLGPKEYMDDLPVEQLGRINPIPEDQTTMSSPTGTVISSGFNNPGSPLHVFRPFPTDALSFDSKEQWFCPSRNLNESQFIGYVFSDGRKFNLNAVHILARVGTQENPAKLAPTPKIVRIEGLSESGDWEAITEDIAVKEWQFMTPNSFDFGDKVTAEHVGYRLVIVEWNPGADDDMFPGLFKLKFICTPTNLVKVPVLPCPDNNYRYAKHNLSLLHKDSKETPLKDHPRVIGYNKDEVVRIVKEIIDNEYDDTVDIAYEQVANIVKEIIEENYKNLISNEENESKEHEVSNGLSEEDVISIVKRIINSNFKELKNTISEEVISTVKKEAKMPSYDSFVMGIVSKYKIDKIPLFTETIDKFITLGKSLTNIQDRNREELLKITSNINLLNEQYNELENKIANGTVNGGNTNSNINASDFVARKAFDNEVNKLNAKIRNARLDNNAVEEFKTIKDKFEELTTNINVRVDNVVDDINGVLEKIDNCEKKNTDTESKLTTMIDDFGKKIDETVSGFTVFLDNSKKSFENQNLDIENNIIDISNKYTLLDDKVMKMYDRLNTDLNNHEAHAHHSKFIFNECSLYELTFSGDIYVCTGDKTVNFECGKLGKNVCVRITLMDNSICSFNTKDTIFEFTQYPDNGSYVKSDAFDANKVGMQVYLAYNFGLNKWTVISKN